MYTDVEGSLSSKYRVSKGKISRQPTVTFNFRGLEYYPELSNNCFNEVEITGSLMNGITICFDPDYDSPYCNIIRKIQTKGNTKSIRVNADEIGFPPEELDNTQIRFKKSANSITFEPHSFVQLKRMREAQETRTKELDEHSKQVLENRNTIGSLPDFDMEIVEELDKNASQESVGTLLPRLRKALAREGIPEMTVIWDGEHVDT